MAPSRWRKVAGPALAIALTALVTRPAAAVELTGHWSGYWKSCTTGHTGPLEATFCRINASQYRADFSGRFFKILPFRYSVTLDVIHEEGETVELAGSSYLGRLFGTFHYRAEATGCNFTADYASCKDSGQFVLCRSGCCGR
jgi:hypothetical protein